jgi:hypothetical protein
MRSGRMWNGDEPVRRSTRGADRCGLRGRPKPGLLIGPWRCRSPDRGMQRAPLACFGICALQASACGLPIRPVLKHGPRSLTCVRVNGRVNP